jgi:hypothetical protein
VIPCASDPITNSGRHALRAPAGWASEATRRTYGQIRAVRRRPDERAPWRQPKTIVIAAGAGVAVIVIVVGAFRARSRRPGMDEAAPGDSPQQSIEPDPAPADTADRDRAQSAHLPE